MEKKLNFVIIVREGNGTYCGTSCPNLNVEYGFCDMFRSHLIYAGTEDDDITKKFCRCQECHDVCRKFNGGYDEYREDR